MKKTITFTLIAALILVAGASLAFAADPATTPPYGMGMGMMNCPLGQTGLTDAQKQELAPLYAKMLEDHKAILQKNVEFGRITQEQADQIVAQMQQCQQGNGPCQGMMGHHRGQGMMGRGYMGQQKPQ